MTVRILVVDDHPMFRLGLVALLGSMDGLEVVAEAATLAAAVAAVDELEIDVVIMDLHLGDDSGVAATREVLSRRPGIGVLVVTMLDDDDNVVAALRAGARGYLLKGAGPAEIERGIRAVAAGEVLLAPGVASRAVPLLTGARRVRGRTVPAADRA